METKACTVCLMNCLKLHGDDDEDADRDKRMLDSSRGRKGAASHLLPSFLKKMTEIVIKSKLQMPASFVRNSVIRIGKTIILEGPSTEKWSVEVWPCSIQKSSLELRDGWQKFVKDHNVQIGDQLCFTLTSDSHFQVMVYDESGSQKESAMDAINSAVAIKHEPKHLSKAQVRSDVQFRTKGPVARPKQKVTRRIRIESAVKPTVVVVHSSDSELRNSEPPETDVKNLKEIVSKDCPGMARSLADQKPLLAPHVLLGGHVVSQRRSVTPAEKERALNAARDLADTLTNPKLVMVMTKAYVYTGFWMALNRIFSNAHMPHESREVTLCNKAGHKWPVKWLFKTTTNSSGFSGGWRGFALDNRLEESDVCVFEMMDEKYFVILVHLFRAIGQPSEDAGDYRPSPGRGRDANRRKRKATDSPLDTSCTNKKLFHSGDLKSPAGCSRAKYLYRTQSQKVQMVGCSQKQQKDTCTANHGRILHQDEGKEANSTPITSSCDTGYTSDGTPTSEALETFERGIVLKIRPLHAMQSPRKKTGSSRDYLMNLGKELVGQQAAMAAPKRSSPPASRKTQISPSFEI